MKNDDQRDSLINSSKKNSIDLENIKFGADIEIEDESVDLKRF